MLTTSVSHGRNGDAGESLFHGVLSSFGIFMGKSGVLFFVSFHVLDEVDVVDRFLEFLKVFSVDNVAEFVLNFDNKFNSIEGVKSMIGKKTVESNCSFLCAEEVIA